MNDTRQAYGQLLLGFDDLARALGGTLGPGSGTVLCGSGTDGGELVSSSAVLARRITQLHGHRRNTGAALLRETVLRVGAGHGDGCATTAVLAQALLHAAAKSVAAGAHPGRVRSGIALGVAAACGAMKDLAEPVAGELDLAGIALAATGDPELAALLAELTDVTGTHGAIRIQEADTPRAGRHYIDGARWPSRPAERAVLSHGVTELTLTEPVIALADLELSDAGQVRPLLEAAARLPARRPLLLVARAVSGAALTMLNANRSRVLPVVLTTARTRQSEDLMDLALLTGASVISPELGLAPSGVQASHLGGARRAFVRRGDLTLTGGHGGREAAGDRAATLRTVAWELLDGGPGERETAERLWWRQARLTGRTAVLTVGAATEQEVTARRDTAERTVRLLQGALRHGVVAGGGVAYLDCVPAVHVAARRCHDHDEALGAEAVATALEAPFLRILSNAGVTAPEIELHRVRELGPGHGIDVATGRPAEMRRLGIRDAASVTCGALEAAAETAGLLVSAEVVVGRA
ncbi:hypothetical protein H1V43_30820 [Streptomyces sp. PSKA54]|uniref:60 kDa chaperonin n=1 Tax=Streptomyces himalayensis subsp. aureolus TaxID=2758039 RepID=A0A7W2D6W3_9ACTN|nr:TCP-1/cpn60 chaperonin family protein [Streptomyces himalayensis]MBA4865657.1 hypothetical protein [Streptomyces himalayensis subsp. aureolus]